MKAKKLISILLTLTMALALFAACASGDNEDATASGNVTATKQNSAKAGGKSLVVYFSAQGHTETVAKEIAEAAGADLLEIIPVDEYSEEDLDWTTEDSRVNKEHEDESLRDIPLTTTEVENWDSYETIYIGYPIWWGIAAWPVDNFVKNNDFTGKDVIPFATSQSSGLGDSAEILAGYAENKGNWREGQRFSSNASNDEVADWVASISE